MIVVADPSRMYPKALTLSSAASLMSTQHKDCGAFITKALPGNRYSLERIRRYLALLTFSVPNALLCSVCTFCIFRKAIFF
jgi:hypothetical protein